MSRIRSLRPVRLTHGSIKAEERQDKDQGLRQAQEEAFLTIPAAERAAEPITSHPRQAWISVSHCILIFIPYLLPGLKFCFSESLHRDLCNLKSGNFVDYPVSLLMAQSMPIAERFGTARAGFRIITMPMDCSRIAMPGLGAIASFKQTRSRCAMCCLRVNLQDLEDCRLFKSLGT